jgi:hypothetical protein
MEPSVVSSSSPRVSSLATNCLVTTFIECGSCG